MAASVGDTAIVEILLEKGANVNQTNFVNIFFISQYIFFISFFDR